MLLQALFKVPQTQANNQGKQRRRRSNGLRKWWVISVSVHRSRTFSPISVVNYCHHCASWEKKRASVSSSPLPLPSPPPPSIFFFFFFCSRSSNSTGNACYAGYPAIETSNWCLLIGPFIGDELRKSTKAVVAENFNLDLASIRQLEQVYAPTGCYSRTHHHGQSHRGGIFEFEFKQNLRYREPLPYYCVSLSPSQLLRDFTVLSCSTDKARCSLSMTHLPDGRARRTVWTACRTYSPRHLERSIKYCAR